VDVKLRPGTPEDAETCGRICYEAFGAIARQHTFPPDFPAPEVGIGLVSMLLGHPGFYSVVAEVNGAVVGSNFLDQRSTIAGVGPITVDPSVQDRTVGRALMQDVMGRAAEQGVPGIRLLQSAYHNRSLSLYASSDSRFGTCWPVCRARRRTAKLPAIGSGKPPPTTPECATLSAGVSTAMTGPVR
jgi:predicted N-acetyltransferase YhbS